MFLQAVGRRAVAAAATAATAATAARAAMASSEAQRAETPPPTFFASWFCPYAQRVWIALEEKGITYQYVEIDPYEAAGAPGQYTKRALPLDEKRRRYPDFVAASPRGLVPALACPGDGDDAVCDSVVMLEYLEERWPSAAPLLPDRPAERAHVRFWCVYATEKIIPFYYRMLMARDEPGRAAAKAQVVEGLKGWVAACADDGPYFLGARFSVADLFLFPWYERLLTVGAAYRGFEPPPCAEFERLGRWHAAVRSRPAVARTLADRARLVENYSGYADGSATSDVAKRFRVAG
jgi:glutathione S-transferase